ncbi:hypothetical protein BYT27DRAFT_7265821 [Phlegmacium glaucopus]|nr:hypothetical protein BYT27DRAFT_7265821 [Phlegmacium glaucopus]
MVMPSLWSLFTTRGPLNKASILLDTTCFSTTGFNNFDNFQALLQKKVLSNGVLDVRSRYNHPTFPSPKFLTTLIQQECFKEYISTEFCSPDLHLKEVSTTTNPELLQKEVNATIANSLLNTVIPHAVQVTSADLWVCKAIFPDEVLPVPFKDACLDSIPECWDNLRIQHGLIKVENPHNVSTNYADRDVNTDIVDVVDEVDKIDGGVGEVDEVDPERNAFIIQGAEDRSFSRVSHKVAPSGGYCLCKPDIILIN